MSRVSLCSPWHFGHRSYGTIDAVSKVPAPVVTQQGWVDVRVNRGKVKQLRRQAELLGRVSQHARRVEAIDVIERNDLRQRPSRIDPWPLARELWAQGGKLKIRGFRPSDAKAGASARTDEQDVHAGKCKI